MRSNFITKRVHLLRKFITAWVLLAINVKDSIGLQCPATVEKGAVEVSDVLNEFEISSFWKYGLLYLESQNSHKSGKY